MASNSARIRGQENKLCHNVKKTGSDLFNLSLERRHSNPRPLLTFTLRQQCLWIRVLDDKVFFRRDIGYWILDFGFWICFLAIVVVSTVDWRRHLDASCRAFRATV